VGLARHVHLGHGPGLYELGRSAPEYLVCDSCDAAVAVEPAELDDVRDLIRARFGYETRFGHFPIVGLCPHCVTPTPGPKGATHA
jgi:Fur family ferric uptake transcriptional regulator